MGYTSEEEAHHGCASASNVSGHKCNLNAAVRFCTGATGCKEVGQELQGKISKKLGTLAAFLHIFTVRSIFRVAACLVPAVSGRLTRDGVPTDSRKDMHRGS
jgi:hypothetical protein